MEEDGAVERPEPESRLVSRALDAVIKRATWRNIVVLWMSLAVFSLAVIGPAYGKIEDFSGGVGAVDNLIVYRPEKVYEMVADYGGQGRRYYASIALTLDTLFPLLLGMTFGLTLARLYSQAFSRRGVLYRALSVPLGAMVADLLENAGIVTMLLSYPRRLPALALLTSSFSTVKWTALAAELVLVVIGLAVWLVSALWGRRSKA